MGGIIGCFYDCDQTLVKGFMQKVLFDHYDVVEDDFWDESNALHADKSVSHDFENAYMNLMLDYVERGTFKDLSNAKLRELGAGIEVFEGLPEFFESTKQYVEKKYEDTTVEHYIITTGLKEMVLGSKLKCDALTDVFGSEFVEQDGVIKRIGRAIGHMKKTEFIHKVNKGCNVDSSVDVNQRMSREGRRIDFRNMIYVGDGFTDVPCFALIKDREGIPLGVYDSESDKAQEDAKELMRQRRVFSVNTADYKKNSRFERTFKRHLSIIAASMQ